MRGENRMPTILVATPMCTPIRGMVLTALEPYGLACLHVKAYAESEAGTGRDGAGVVKGKPVLRNVAEVTVKEGAAKWAEYLLLRTGKFALVSKPLDPRNERWAAKWGGKMPVPWQPTGDCKATKAPAPAPKSARKRTVTPKKRSLPWWMKW